MSGRHGDPLPRLTIIDLRLQAETMVSLSLSHLCAATRLKLGGEGLSVDANPTACGGFVHVGKPGHRLPTEPDLARIFEAAGSAGIAWLRFEQGATVIDGLPVFEDLPEATSAASPFTDR